MTRSDVQRTLISVYPTELVNSMLTSYEKAVAEYKKQHWQYFGNEIGQFIEVIRRLIEFKLYNKYTPLEKKLPNFNERILIEWENCDVKHAEVYRVIIPRGIYFMYCLRNKRGMIHKNHIDPNRMDASVLLSNAKWVLSEIFRQVSTMSFEETEAIVNSIMTKESTIIWDNGKILRVLDTKMASKDKIICLLYMKEKMTDLEIQKSIEYKNWSDFKKILKSLHKSKLIEYDSPNCILSPLGVEFAEKILSA